MTQHNIAPAAPPQVSEGGTAVLFSSPTPDTPPPFTQTGRCHSYLVSLQLSAVSLSSCQPGKLSLCQYVSDGVVVVWCCEGWRGRTTEDQRWRLTEVLTATAAPQLGTSPSHCSLLSSTQHFLIPPSSSEYSVGAIYPVSDICIASDSVITLLW